MREAFHRIWSAILTHPDLSRAREDLSRPVSDDLQTIFGFSDPSGADGDGGSDGGGGWKNSQSCSTPPLPVQGENIPVWGNSSYPP